MGDKVGDKSLNATQVKVLAEIRNNPNITKPQLSLVIGVGKTSIDKALSTLKNMGYIQRIGSNKTGYWHVKID